MECGESGVMGEADGEELDEAVIGNTVEAVLPGAELNVGAPAENGEQQTVEVFLGGSVGQAQLIEHHGQCDVC